jgi:hypothetical protein
MFQNFDNEFEVRLTKGYLILKYVDIRLTSLLTSVYAVLPNKSMAAALQKAFKP